MDKNNLPDKNGNDCFLLSPITINSLCDDRLLLCYSINIVVTLSFVILKMNLDTSWMVYRCLDLILTADAKLR